MKVRSTHHSLCSSTLSTFSPIFFTHSSVLHIFILKSKPLNSPFSFELSSSQLSSSQPSIAQSFPSSNLPLLQVVKSQRFNLYCCSYTSCDGGGDKDPGDALEMV
ncbi:uncharacterized protein LOC110727030 [Chenopodium quinoa]|uniref:uncharacterized protein LOC110727030 n=1 Tax=Chenopodium quinoa TaxID=63459 RepID=UPI000B7745E0|nr:uncharacterized protein LOC110727030 [Chenopodium quinoa]